MRLKDGTDGVAAPHPFEEALSVLTEEIAFAFRGHMPAPWADFWLNPRRLRGTDFLMRWSQGEWSEKRLVEAVNETGEFVCYPYGPSGVAPADQRSISRHAAERAAMKTRGRTRHQILAASGEAREALRAKGQFWTPAWVAEAMVHYAVGGGAEAIFDPAVGAGAFFRAVKAVAHRLERPLALSGTEIDPETLYQARQNGLTAEDLADVQIADFLLPVVDPRTALIDTPLVSGRTERLLPAIVANPPYIRHHRLPKETKERLREYGRRVIGTALDGRAGYHVYFLIHALTRLERDGRLAFIMPADSVEGVFAPVLWRWITDHFRLDAVVTFAPDATPFPGVDTNAVVFMLRNAAPQEAFWWARCARAETDDLRAWVASGFAEPAADTLAVQRRTFSEGLATGLSRSPREEAHTGPTLGHYARVVRGIATGDNDFFFLTRAQATELGIPDAFLLRAIGRTRDLIGDTREVTPETLRALDASGRPTFLFSPDGRALEHYPEAVRRYLREGERRGLPHRALIGMRNPWYKMEVRAAPPFLFAYLGRRSARFVRNRAGVVPLTGFLCVYPREGVDADALWTVLSHPRTVDNLERVGKSYGDGAIKVEPRALDRLPLPPEVVLAAGLPPAKPSGQMVLVAD